MVAFDVHWERWCKITILKHFNDGKGDTELFAEGFVRETEHLTDYVEVRVDGPYTQELSRRKWKLYFEVNILVVVKINNEDAYRINRLTARMTDLFTDCLAVYKFGTEIGVDDPLVFVGHLKLVPQRSERIQTSHFGKIRPDTQILQASVEGHYHIHFD